jgi:hypothetical protein
MRNEESRRRKRKKKRMKEAKKAAEDGRGGIHVCGRRKRKKEEGRGREKRWNDVQLHLIGLGRAEPQNRGVYHLLSNCAPQLCSS